MSRMDGLPFNHCIMRLEEEEGEKQSQDLMTTWCFEVVIRAPFEVSQMIQYQ